MSKVFLGLILLEKNTKPATANVLSNFSMVRHGGSMETQEQLIATAEENLDYDIVGSTAKARLCVVALRKLKLRRPRFVTLGGNQATYEDLMSLLTAAEAWLTANGGMTGAPGSGAGAGSGVPSSTSQTVYYDLSDIRR